MFRRPSGAILCPSCGRLTSAEAPVCLVCGRRSPGMWGFGGPLARLFRAWNFTNAVTAACVGLYVVSLVFDPASALRPQGLFDIFSPSRRALDALGMTGRVPWAEGRWWTLLTAIYLHGGVLHILFNVLWIRQLGPAVEELYGPARLVVIFTVSGVAGFVVSNSLGVPFTIGASRSPPWRCPASPSRWRSGPPSPAEDTNARADRPGRRPSAGFARAICSGGGLGGGRRDPLRSKLPRQRPTLPRRYQRSTIGPGGLNFRVRDGNGRGPSGNATGNRHRSRRTSRAGHRTRSLSSAAKHCVSSIEDSMRP